MLPWLSDEDTEHYLMTYERIAQACKWPRLDWVLHLLPLLTGKARAAYVAMEPDNSLNYDCVKQVILDKFEINPENFRQRFRADETLRELYVRLKDLYEKWMVPSRRTKQEIGDQIVLEQFLKELNPEARMWVKQNSPTSCKQAAEMVETFMAARRSLHQQRRWRGFNHSSTGKSGDAKGSGLKDFDVDNRTLHTRSTLCNSMQSGGVSHFNRTVIICHSCGHSGHKKADCPVQNVANTHLCYELRSTVKLNDIELNTDTVIDMKIGNTLFKALVDSGSSQTLVRPECLGKLNMLKHDKLKVCCIHGDEKEYPKTEIVIEIGGQAYSLTVGVTDKAPYPVILGRDWLPYLMFAYREVPQSSTGFSPFEMLYGRQVCGSLDVLKEAWEGGNAREQTHILSYVIKMRGKLSAMTDLVSANMTKAQQQQKHWYDQSSRKRTLTIGQKVLLLLSTSESSLLAKWQGPYEVLRKLSPTNYEISLPDRKKKSQIFHINLLRPWNERKGSWSEQLWATKVEDEEE
uniref:CCHC-type domain-containing protein n=1 Tax=Sinocyclocheilus rhinocerous TaxID=307959 RepID=A0A673ICM5_9TELE